MDEAKDNLKKFKEKVDLPIFEVSAFFNEGLTEVIDELSITRKSVSI